MILQRFLVVHQRQTIESDHHLVDWHVALDLAQSLETLQLHVLDHVQDEDVVAERGYCYLHRAVCALRTYLVACAPSPVLAQWSYDTRRANRERSYSKVGSLGVQAKFDARIFAAPLAHGTAVRRAATGCKQQPSSAKILARLAGLTWRPHLNRLEISRSSRPLETRGKFELRFQCVILWLAISCVRKVLIDFNYIFSPHAEKWIIQLRLR